MEEEEARRLQKEAGKLKADAQEAEEKKLEEEAKRLQEEAEKLKAEAEEAQKAKTEKERHTAEQEQERLAKVKAQMKGASKDELVGAPKFKKNETEEEKAKRINEAKLLYGKKLQKQHDEFMAQFSSKGGPGKNKARSHATGPQWMHAMLQWLRDGWMHGC